jgi:integrase|tara:strand:- start:1800 stop:3017 length:1218 start_codon:yes stop_codon:yes gene_type:complete
VALSRRDFDSLKGKPKSYSLSDGGGLNVKVLPDGRKSMFLMYRTRAGRQRKLTFGEISLTEARKQTLAAKAKIAQGLDPQEELKQAKAQQMSLGQFIADRYKPYLEANHADPKASLWILQVGFKQLLNVPMEELTLNHVELWRNKQKQLAASTINRRVGALKASLEKARLWGFITSNPITDWKKVKVPKEPVEFLTQAQVQVLFNALEARDKKKRTQRISHNQWRNQRDQEPLPDYDELGMLFTDYLSPLVLLVLDTGLRFGEAINLKWPDISNNVITAKSSKTGNFRYIPLTTDCQTMLTELQRLNEANSGRATSNVFVDEKGTPLSSVKTAWNNIRRELSFNCDFRMLRRTFGSRLIEKGVPVYHVSQLMGHTNVQTTQRWYLSLNLDAYRDAILTIDDFLSV